MWPRSSKRLRRKLLLWLKFYELDPISAMPLFFQLVLRLNPLSAVVEGFRRVMIWGQPPDWPWWGVATIVSALAMGSGYAWFIKRRRCDAITRGFDRDALFE